MEINMMKKIPVQAKTLKVCVKVTDRFCATLADQDGKTIHEFEDCYVPDFMPGQHYGDYLMLNIDIDTGQITNWTAPSAEEIEEIIKGKED
ncbi:hypothetical protein BOC60_20210 [Burkholderia pseudomallei]|nr:hypothetical protein BOC60_20210 [Burkholderia pseudomallei]